MNSLSFRDSGESRRFRLISVSLAIVTVVLYGQLWKFEFTNYDDPYLITANPAVSGGLTLRGLWWGLTTSYFEFWHPVTWWSHMLDCELFGLRPGWHHLMSLGFHVANALVLFAALHRMTGALWRSAVVAALFALHPMHVESVAWLAERKDLLGAFFWLLCLWRYAGYARESAADNPKAKGHYRRALLFFVLGLMSKPMVVTLPFVLLLLDYWPLRRLELSTLKERPSTGWRLIREKLPFFGLTLVSCLITLIGTSRASNILSAEKLSWGMRAANVPVSYFRYLWKLFWPVDLAVLYPMPSHWEAWQVLGASAVVLAVSVLVLVLARAAPYLVFGWFSFLGVLVPTIGLVPVGFQSIADRYTYLSYIGLFVAIVWALADVTRHWRFRRSALAAATAVSLVTCWGLAWAQVQHWRNSAALWSRCLAVDSENAIAHYNLGHTQHHSGKVEEAFRHYQEAFRLKPDHLDANLNLGVLMAERGQWREATNRYAKALEIKPEYDKAHVNMAIALLQLKDFSGATNHCAQALKVSPRTAQTHSIFACALLELGDYEGAMRHAAEAIRLDPADFRALAYEGRALAGQGRSAEAVRAFTAALNLNPRYAEAYYHLGVEWLIRGDLDAAIANLQEAVCFNPASADAHFQLGLALAVQRKTREAVAHYREALRLSPDLLPALNNLAWILATHPDAEVRDGAAAVTVAERACNLTTYDQTIYIGTLAAAYAEAGQFEKAVSASRKACELAAARGETNLFTVNQKLLRQFQEGKPHREER